MPHESLPELLARVDLFEGVPDVCIDELIQAGSTMHTKPGNVVVREGSDDAGLHIVMDGSAVVDVGGDLQSEKLGPGDYFGEISVIDGGARSATITAGDQGLDTFMVSPLEFWSILERQPQLARPLLRHLATRVRELDATSRGGLC